ncbi:MAG: formylglycine-generating enzyme family protein [Bacteroidales bacterium]|jgi:formylglycine-generating enzyme required for sulfatase activity|nr:formylglycine-generating enzyme family protein [Bacteroidales bacterium]
MKQKQTVRFLGLLLLSAMLLSNIAVNEPPAILEASQRFVKVSERLYADKYEVTVKDYQLFLAEQKSKGIDCAPLMCDSLCWMKERGYAFSPHHYFGNVAYLNYPIICISYAAAQQFCQWLTEKYNSLPQKEFTKALFRLPSKQEFIKAAVGKYNEQTIFPWANGSLYDEKGERRCNFLEFKQEDLDYKNNEMLILWYDTPSSFPETDLVYSYASNSIGLYNVSGNAAEMVQEKGIAMGGSWASSGYNVRVSSEQKYDAPSTTVGFRVFMEILSE